MPELHSLVRRQLKKLGLSPDELPIDLEAWQRLLEKVNNSYTSADRDRYLLERSLAVSSQEMLELNESLRDSAERRAEARELQHKELVRASRLAGRAEVATNVLHNVGNVLNSVNVSACSLLAGLQRSSLVNLAKVVALIDAQENTARFFSEDPKGRRLPGYLSRLAEVLASENEEQLEHAARLTGLVKHIDRVVKAQQSLARRAVVTETCLAHELGREALLVADEALAAAKATVEVDCPADLEVHLDKHLVLEILVNLLRNAAQAVNDVSPEQRLVRLITSGEAGEVCFAVEDTGVGIQDQNLRQIFNHGFTTREAGSGFGLHSASLAAKSIGGQLVAESDGVDRGARFVLRLPLGVPTRRAG